MNFLKKSLLTIMVSSVFVGCANTYQNPNFSNKTTGTLGGAAAGALIGQAIGHNTKGTLIGAAVGSLAGLGWGAYRDKQEVELQERLRNSNVAISRNGDYLNLTLPGGVTFETNSSSITPSFFEPLNSISEVLSQYPESRIEISGFTDNVGSPQYNFVLSEKRAFSVADYLTRRGVASNRIIARGYGADNFIASNSTPQGRATNRRVEIKILPPSNY